MHVLSSYNSKLVISRRMYIYHSGKMRQAKDSNIQMKKHLLLIRLLENSLQTIDVTNLWMKIKTKNTLTPEIIPVADKIMQNKVSIFKLSL